MNNQTKAYIYGLTTVLLWSTVATAFKIALRHMSPEQLLFYANITSVFLLFGIILWQKKVGQLKSIKLIDLKLPLILGFLNPFLYYWVLFKAYDLLPAQEAQPLNYTWAITLSLLAVPLLKQKLRKIDLLAVGISYFGILVIATHGAPFSLKFSNITGVLLALGSTLIWAFYWIFNTKSRADPLIGLFLSFVFGLPFVTMLALYSGDLLVTSLAGIAGAIYAGVFEMGVAFVLWLKALKLTCSTAKIANLIFLSPIISLFLIHFIVGEEIHWSSGLGLAFILAGNALQQIKPKSTRTKRLNAG